MAVPLFTKSRYRTILLIAASLLVVAVAATGTVLLLKQFGPSKQANTETISDNKSPLEKAEDLYAKGDYAGAKTQYQNILDTYKSEKNEAAAKDIEMQIKVIDAMAKATPAPQNTDRNRVTVGSVSEE